MPPKKWYAVAIGRQPGIYTTWDETQAQVEGYAGNKHKSFKSKDEAERYIEANKDTKDDLLGTYGSQHGDAETQDTSTQSPTPGASSPSPSPSLCSCSSPTRSSPTAHTPVALEANTAVVKTEANGQPSTPSGGKQGYRRQRNRGQTNKGRLDIRVNVSRV